MLLPEARLDTLLDQLQILPAGDRRAILARLSREQQQQVRARLRGASVEPQQPRSQFSADIAGRVAALDGAATDGAMTPAGRAALARALALKQGDEPEAPVSGSLVDALVNWIWPRRSPA